MFGGILSIVLEEFLIIKKFARWKLRGMVSRNCIPENSQTQTTCWRVNIEPEVRANTPELTMSWINEVEMAGFIGLRLR